MNEAAEKLGRLLVIARQARNPGAVFHELRQVNPASPELPPPGFKPDCIRADAAGAHDALKLAFELGVPLLVSADADPEALRSASCVAASSEHAAACCIERGADPARVVTLFESVDRERFAPDGDPAPGPQDHPRLLSVEHDNLDRVLRACERAAARHPRLKLIHLGSVERPLPAFAESREDVRQEEYPAWFRWADALFLPALRLESGRVLAEALSCGTPCITSSRPPMNEVVSDRWDGLLVNPEEVGDIARAIDEIADPSLRARLAAPARTSSELFDAAAVDAREAALYRWLLRRDWPLLTVVLPTFNRARLVEGAVRNVLGQDYPNLELIVVNDGSSDDTPAVLQRMEAELNDPRLRVVHRENGGLPAALNTGFEMARGEYWTWTSDDNGYRPSALRALARELELQPEVGLVYADMQIRDEFGGERSFTGGPPENLEQGSCVGGCFLYRAAIARQVGAYDAKYTLAEDFDYWLRMHRITRFAWLHRLLYDYADAPHSLTRRRFREMQAVQMKLFEREQGGRADWRQRKFEHLLRHASAAKNQGLPGAAMSAAWRAIRHRPWVARGWWALLRALTPMPLLNLSRRMRGLDAG